MGHEEITKIRLHGWKKRLAENKATPVLMVGVGIEGKETGRLVVIATEERTDEEIRGFLTYALMQLTPS